MASKHISHAGNPMKALYSIFVQPTLTTSRAIRPQRLNRNVTAPQHLTNQTRYFACSPHLSLSKHEARAPEVRSQKWNEEITARMVQLVDPVTQKLNEPTPRYGVLRNLDLKTHRLVQLTSDDPEDRNFVPVCKIVSKKESYEQDKKKKVQQKEVKQAAAKERSIKTLELNWAIDGNDLAHRLEKVKSFLEEGRRVEIVLASKKRGRKATLSECKELLEKIEEVSGSVNGAKELKAFEGKMGGFATLAFQGKAGAVAKEEVKEEAKEEMKKEVKPQSVEE